MSLIGLELLEILLTLYPPWIQEPGSQAATLAGASGNNQGLGIGLHVSIRTPNGWVTLPHRISTDPYSEQPESRSRGPGIAAILAGLHQAIHHSAPAAPILLASPSKGPRKRPRAD